jgi:hypothetical protein
MSEYRSDDLQGIGYCPTCGRRLSIDVALFGTCPEHGRVPADFARPTGWADPDDEEADDGAGG